MKKSHAQCQRLELCAVLQECSTKDHEGVLLLVKLQPATLLKVTVLHGCFSGFKNCVKGTKSRNASQHAPTEEVVRKQYEFKPGCANYRWQFVNGQACLCDLKLASFNSFSNLLVPTEPFPPSVTQTRRYQHYLVISWKRPLLMNGQPLQCQIEFPKIKSCTSHECKRSIQLSEPVNITRKSDPVEANQNMTVWLVMKEEVKLDYFSKYEVRVRESTVKGWGPYSKTSLFQIGEGGT